MKKLIAAILLAGVLFAINIMEVSAVESDREVLNFNSGWLYSPLDYTNAQQKNFDDSAFESVCVPHANTVLSKYKGEGSSFLEQIASYRFVSWYRRHFTLAPEYAAKRVAVEFEGVATVAEVYVNGKYIDTHKGAYTGFTMDITDALILGADNVIAVRVDSTRRSDIPPEGGSVDYCLFGGIVRDVRMIVTDALYIDNVFITTPIVSAAEASVNVKATVKSDAGAALCSAEAVICDGSGNVLATLHGEQREVSGEAVFEMESGKIENPRLWDIEAPYLHTVKISIKKDGVLCDSYTERIGFRYFEFTPSGLMLNGRVIKLRGVNRHEQWPWQGRAIPNKLQARDADMVKDTGFNTVRCSHYPQDKAFLERCDEIGLIVFEEAPGWQHIGDEGWKELYIKNITEMILRDRNHPSILTWGVRVNESWDSDELYTKTTTLAKSMDSTRPTHGVRQEGEYATTSAIEDLFCVNYKSPAVPRMTPFIITEHSNDWYVGHGFSWASNADSMTFTESFANVLNYYYGNDLCAGGLAWSMFDYDNEVNYTRSGNVFYSGVYDIFRLPKSASYFYRSQKEPEKETVLYISNYWASDAPDKVIVYSNCDEVELFVNGTSKGKIRGNLYTNIPHPAFSFENIAYAAGTLEAVGYIDGKEVKRTVNKTPLAPSKLKLTPDYDSIVADGTDMTQVTIELLDENGTRLPYAANTVNITLTGAGEFIGEQSVNLEAGRIAFIVKSKYMQTGDIVCTVTSDGVQSASCTIAAEEYIEENAVPFSTGEGSEAPRAIGEYNDTDKSFEYSPGWLYVSQSGCYKGDNHYSNTSGATLTQTFIGSAIEWYGSVNANHGIVAISVDGGAETFIDLYSKTRADNKLLYVSQPLSYGTHTLSVRVTGTKNASASDSYVTADHVRVSSENTFKTTKPYVKAYDGAWESAQSTWSANDGEYIQSAQSGDCLALYKAERLQNASIRALIEAPSKNGAGNSIVARAADNSHFYLLELKVVNNALTWAIWKNANDTWTSLVGGPCNAVSMGEKAYVRLDTYQNTLCAYISKDGVSWQALGACSDSEYQSGFCGVRTHSGAARFGEFTVAYEANLKYTIADALIEDDILKSVTLENGEGVYRTSEKLVAADYENGVLTDAKSYAIEGKTVEINMTHKGDTLKLFVWDDNLIPIALPYEIKK